jgi:uracil-DNA glycosylase
VKTLLVGEAPARTTVGARPFSGRTGARLAELAGVERLRDSFEVVNLLDRWPGPTGAKGSEFPMEVARARAAAMVPRLVLRRRRVVLVGRRVAGAFRLARLPYLSWERIDGLAEVAVLPHPSGVNQWYNDPGNVERARRFLREAAA